MKVVTVVGTRPEIVRLSRVMPALDQAVDHVIVHTGQNYDHELNQIFFEDLEIRKPDHFLGAAGATAAETIGLIIAKVDVLLREIAPDAVLGQWASAPPNDLAPELENRVLPGADFLRRPRDHVRADDEGRQVLA